MKLRYKVNAAILITYGMILVIFTGVWLFYKQQRMEMVTKTVKTLLQTLVERDSESLANEIFENQTRAMRIRLRQMASVEGILSIDVFDSKGKWIISSESHSSGISEGVSIQADLSQKDQKKTQQGIYISSAKKQEYKAFLYLQEIHIIGERIGFIRIYYSIEAAEREAHFSMLLFAILLISVLIMMIVVLNLIIFRTIIHPIANLRNFMQGIIDGERGQQVKISSHDEIGDISKTCNQISEDLAKVYQQLRQKNEELNHLNQSLKNRIEQQMKAEMALTESEKKYRDIFENAQEGIVQTTLQGAIISANFSMAKILGYDSPDDLIASVKDMGTQVYVDPNDRKEFIRIIQEKNSVLNFECRFRRKNGSIIWIVSHARSFRNSSGEMILEGFIEDITASKEALEKLCQSEQKYRQLYEGSRDGYVMTDKNGQFIECNSAFCEMLGYSFEELQHLTYILITPEKWHEYEREQLRELVFKRSYTNIYEKEFIRKNGSVFKVETIAYPIRNEQGRIIGFWAVVRDITEKKALQEESVRNARLASIGELAAGVAHEINNPINGIINYTQILLDQCPANNEEADILTRIIKEGDRIESIVRNLLSFAREHKNEKRPADMGNIIYDTLELTAAMLKKDKIQLYTDIPPELPLIFVNTQQIQQVLMNFINNSRYALNQKYSAGGSDKIVEIRCELIEYNGIKTVRTICYDQGTGIPDNIRDRICDPFFTTKPVGKGTGLGLSISHGIIREHDGRLFFESRAGEYTKAIIDLPVYKENSRL